MIARARVCAACGRAQANPLKVLWVVLIAAGGAIVGLILLLVTAMWIDDATHPGQAERRGAIYEAEGRVLPVIGGTVTVEFEAARIVNARTVCGVAVQRVPPLTIRRPWVVYSGVAFVRKDVTLDDPGFDDLAKSYGC